MWLLTLVYLFNKNYVTANYKIGKSVMKPSTKKKKKKNYNTNNSTFFIFYFRKKL